MVQGVNMIPVGSPRRSERSPNVPEQGDVGRSGHLAGPVLYVTVNGRRSSSAARSTTRVLARQDQCRTRFGRRMPPRRVLHDPGSARKVPAGSKSSRASSTRTSIRRCRSPGFAPMVVSCAGCNRRGSGSAAPAHEADPRGYSWTCGRRVAALERERREPGLRGGPSSIRRSGSAGRARPARRDALRFRRRSGEHRSRSAGRNGGRCEVAGFAGRSSPRPAGRSRRRRTGRRGACGNRGSGTGRRGWARRGDEADIAAQAAAIDL